MSLLSLFMASLIFSTSTITVTASHNWGTLAAGDNIKWTSDYWGDVEIKIISVEGSEMTYERTRGGSTATYTVDADVVDITYTMTKSLISSVSRLNDSWEVQEYTWKGSTYKAFYDKDTIGEREIEEWFDYNTGILFEYRVTDSGEITKQSPVLESTTADLARVSGGGGGGGCLGTLLIAMFSVTTLVSYGLIRYRKKKLE